MIFISSTFNEITSFPWKLNRYSYKVQFGIHCIALDQSKLGNFVECTIKTTMKILNNYMYIISRYTAVHITSTELEYILRYF